MEADGDGVSAGPPHPVRGLASGDCKCLLPRRRLWLNTDPPSTNSHTGKRQLLAERQRHFGFRSLVPSGPTEPTLERTDKQFHIRRTDTLSPGQEATACDKDYLMP